MKRALILLTLCLFATGVAIAQPAPAAKALNVHTFQFKYKDADKAAAIIKPLMSSDSVKLDDFRLSKVQNDQLNQVYKATLNLKVGQTLIFGATKTAGQRAIFLVFNARR